MFSSKIGYSLSLVLCYGLTGCGSLSPLNSKGRDNWMGILNVFDRKVETRYEEPTQHDREMEVSNDPRQKQSILESDLPYKMRLDSANRKKKKALPEYNPELPTKIKKEEIKPEREFDKVPSYAGKAEGLAKIMEVVRGSYI